MLLDFKQSSPGDHVQLSDVLKALGIDASPPSNEDLDKSATCQGASGQTS